MLESRKKRRELRQRIDSLKQKQISLREEQHQTPAKETEDALRAIRREIRSADERLEIFESRRIEREAEQLGIEIEQKSGWWKSDYDEIYHAGISEQFLEDMITRWLSPLGRAAVAHAIRNRRRENREWWFKIILAAITAITGLLGTLIGVLAVWKD